MMLQFLRKESFVGIYITLNLYLEHSDPPSKFVLIQASLQIVLHLTTINERFPVNDERYIAAIKVITCMLIMQRTL